MDEGKVSNEIISEITQNADGKFEVSMPAAGKFDRKCRKRIESNTNTRINMPYKKPFEGKIQIEGSDRLSVESALKEIESIIAQQRRRLTHFLSIPINDKGIIDKFIEFKNEVMQSNANVTDEYFQKTFKLHLSLGVLSLYSDERKNSAIKALQECRDIIDGVKTRFNTPTDLRIKVVGVNCMHDNPPNCRILYGMVESEYLQTMVIEIVEHFITNGLIEKDKKHVKLHITMMNVVFVKRITGNRVKKFDASGIVEAFTNYKFGDQNIDAIHLSRLERTGEFTYYESDGILNV